MEWNIIGNFVNITKGSRNIKFTPILQKMNPFVQIIRIDVLLSRTVGIISLLLLILLRVLLVPRKQSKLVSVKLKESRNTEVKQSYFKFKKDFPSLDKEQQSSWFQTSNEEH